MQYIFLSILLLLSVSNSFKLRTSSSARKLFASTLTDQTNDVTSQDTPKLSNDNFQQPTVVDTFITAWKKSLKGDNTELSQIIQPNAVWDNPFVSSSKEYLDAMKSFSQFYSDPSLTILNTKQLKNNKVEVKYQFSFWYPMFWRPRIIIPAIATIDIDTVNNKVLKVSEKWERSVSELFFGQFFPRLWDVFHLFTSPSPEYPPTKSLGKIDGIEFLEVPSSLYTEVIWNGPADLPGPPLQILPDFSIFGSLQTSKPNRDPFYTVLPADIQSGKYTDPLTGAAMKMSKWLYPVPTALHDMVINKWKKDHDILLNGEQNTDVNTDKYLPLSFISSLPLTNDNTVSTTSTNSATSSSSSSSSTGGLVEEGDMDKNVTEDTPLPEPDYVVGLENMSVMKSLAKGSLRGDFPINENTLKKYEDTQSIQYTYKFIPKRKLAVLNIYGNPDADKVNKAFQKIKSTVTDKASQIFPGKKVSLKMPTLFGGKSTNNTIEPKNQAPFLGLQLWDTKVCFNPLGEPAMVIYEIQWGSKLTKVYVELDIDE